MNPRNFGSKTFDYLVLDMYPSRNDTTVETTVVIPMLGRVLIYVSGHVVVVIAIFTIGEK